MSGPVERVTFDESRLAHIFRDARGHLASDNFANRQILLEVANDPDSILGTDRFGTSGLPGSIPRVGRYGSRYAMAGSQMLG